MSILKTLVILFLIYQTPLLVHGGDTVSPYKADVDRKIKSLTKKEIGGYLNGHGMGQAKVAELNNCPGPKHVLELKEELELTSIQIRKSTELFDRMLFEAIDLGIMYVNKEADLDELFRTKKIDKDSLNRMLSEISALKAKIRMVHLYTHVEQAKILTDEQIRKYNNLRGYSNHNNHHSHH